MTSLLQIGTRWDGKPMTLPADLGDKKIALLAQSKKGKTYGLGDVLEELAKAQRPFIATDPANNLWGLRVRPDGSPSGLPVVVIGGDHADIPFEKDAGERMAELLLATPMCAVIDVAFESRGATRHFMTAFAGRLMRSKPEVPRVVVLEECPVLIPQHAEGAQAQVCKTAVANLAIIGGNFGYGVIPACQRPATMDKNVLSQCEALIVMGITHKPDRDTVKGWMDAKDVDGRAAAAFAELGSLQPGEAWLWWPGEDRFEKFTFRKRETLHPREMQKLGLKASAVQLGDMQAFVEKAKRELARTVVHVQGDLPKNPKTRAALLGMAKLAGESMGDPPARQLHDQALQMDKLKRDLELAQASVSRLEEELRVERGLRAAVERRLDAVRAQLFPQYDALQKLFAAIGEKEGIADGAAQDLAAWEPWFSKAAEVGCRGMLELLVQRGRLKQQQLATLSGLTLTGGTWKKYRAWITRHGLATIEGQEIVAAVLQ